MVTWPKLDFEQWRATCDTLHAHTQVLGKLAATLAPPEPQLQHAALRLTARGWETLPLPAPDGSGALVVALDLRTPRGGRRAQRRPRASGSRSRRTGPSARSRASVLGAVRRARPARSRSTRRRRRSPWTRAARRGRRARDLRPGARSTTLLRRRDPGRARPRRVPRAVPRALDAGQRLVGLVRPRGEPVLRPAGRPAVGRLHHAQRDGRPGGRRRLVARRCRATASARSTPTRTRRRRASRAPTLAPAPRAGTATLGEYVLDWDDVIADPDPHATALAFARSAFSHSCAVCGWDAALAASAEGTPPPVV